MDVNDKTNQRLNVVKKINRILLILCCICSLWVVCISLFESLDLTPIGLKAGDVLSFLFGTLISTRVYYQRALSALKQSNRVVNILLYFSEAYFIINLYIFIVKSLETVPYFHYLQKQFSLEVTLVNFQALLYSFLACCALDGLLGIFSKKRSVDQRFIPEPNI